MNHPAGSSYAGPQPGEGQSLCDEDAAEGLHFWQRWRRDGHPVYYHGHDNHDSIVNHDDTYGNS